MIRRLAEGFIVMEEILILIGVILVASIVSIVCSNNKRGN